MYNVKKLSIQTLNKIKYNIGSIPSNVKFKYAELLEKIKNCESCIEK